MKSLLEIEAGFEHHSLSQVLFPHRGLQVTQATIFLLITLSSCLLSGLVRADSDPSATTGSISGKVLISRKLTSQRMRFRLYPGFKPLPPPKAEEKRADEWQNIVIYLESAPSISAIQSRNEKKLQIAQLGETFLPHVLPVVKGSTVEFPNRDPIFHNVFSLSSIKSFDLGRYPKGSSRAVTFEKPGIIPVFCHLHSDMSAIVMVLDNPFFTVPRTDGSYRIKDIPAGSYTLVVWHQRSERVEQQVEVISGQPLELNITVPIEDEEASGQ